jgi:phosphate transport system substrate-binding protein
MRISTMKISTMRSAFLGMALGAGLLMPATRAGAQMVLTGAGATFPYPLYSKWFDVYQKATGVRINYQSIGSGGGIQQLKNGTVDFGASDAPLSNGEKQAMPGDVVHIPTVAGAVAMVYNGLPRGLRLSGDAIAGIFLGDITSWNDPKIAALNPNMRLPDKRITVAHRSDGSGTTYIFTNYLKAVSPRWARQVRAGKSVDWPVGLGGKGNEGVAGIVSQAPGSIGYLELAYAIQNHLPYASVRNRSGAFVEPSVAGVTAAAAGASKAMQRDVRVSIVNAPGTKAYPISGFTYILLYEKQNDTAKGQVLLKFLRWALGPGQKYAAPLQYAPLPRSVVALDTAKLRNVH